MKGFFLSFQFYMVQQLKSKGFLITSLLLVGLVAGGFLWQTYKVEEKPPKVLIVVAEGGVYGPQLFEGVSVEAAKKKQKGTEYDGKLTFSKDSIRYDVYNQSSLVDAAVLESRYSRMLQQERMKKDGINPQDIERYAVSASVSVHVKEEQVKPLGLIYLFIMLMYFFLMMYGQTLSMTVVNEKTTKTMELLITKVSSAASLLSRVLAYLCVGCLQIFLVYGAFLLSKAAGIATSDHTELFGFPFDFSYMTWDVVFVFALYFIFGFLLYGFGFCAIGAYAKRMEDLGGMLTPFMFLIIGGMFIGFVSMGDPAGAVAEVTSYIPFFAPFSGFARYVTGEMTVWSLVGSMTILIASCIGSVYVSSRYYRKGVLK